MTLPYSLELLQENVHCGTSSARAGQGIVSTLRVGWYGPGSVPHPHFL